MSVTPNLWCDETKAKEHILAWQYHLKTGNLNLSFLIWIYFISFSCLISFTRTSSTMLKRSGKSRHLCLIPNLKEKAFTPSLLSMCFLWVIHI